MSSIATSTVKNARLPRVFSVRNKGLLMLQSEVVLPFSSPHPPAIVSDLVIKISEMTKLQYVTSAFDEVQDWFCSESIDRLSVHARLIKVH